MMPLMRIHGGSVAGSTRVAAAFVAALVTAVIAAGLVAAPAQAERSGATGPDRTEPVRPILVPTAEGLAKPAIGARKRARIVFDKNWRNPHRSRIHWRVQKRRANGTWRTVEHRSWRAGSGFEKPGATRECVRNQGWLPNGRYSFVQYDNYWGNFIKGRAFYLGDHRCKNGGWRSQLFIHTETGSGNRQCRNAPGDQMCRWEYPRVNDYKSNGCIKMAPGDLKALVNRYHRYFRAGVRYKMAKVQVRVVR